MSERTLLCIARDGNTLRALLPDWQVAVAAGLPEAERLLRKQHYLVGLLLDMSEPVAVRDFLRRHGSLHWVGVVDACKMTQVHWRELCAEHLHDYHTRPLDMERLRHTLGHALGCARLRAASQRHGRPSDAALVGTSVAIARLRTQIAKVAHADAPVLIWGESGTGKELTAQAIHAQSPRAAGPFVPINCGAIAPALIQSELFGHARGAFTGAARDKVGLIESATGGTVFLDEIADLPKDLQANLLRFLQEKTIHRVGATRSIRVDARVVAASHVRLQGAVSQGQFREDLFYRLNVLPIDVPALRDRKDDIDQLAGHFFEAYSTDKPGRLKGYSGPALRAMRAHDWPGNVRELLNRVRRAMVLAEGRLILPSDLGLEEAEAPISTGLDESRQRAERDAILDSLVRSGGNVTHAARALAVSRMTLYRQMAKHGIEMP